MSSSPAYLDSVVLPLIVGDTVLDAGCGVGRWASLIYSNFWEAGLERPPAVDGFDAFEPNVERCRHGQNYRRVWLQRLPSPLEGKWDTVLASELLEHCQEEDVPEALGVLERAAARRVIVTTPNWPAYRPGHDTPDGFNEFEAHLSYVSRRWLHQRGYRVVSVGLLYRPNRVSGALRRLGLARTLESLPLLFHALGDLVVAVKDL